MSRTSLLGFFRLAGVGLMIVGAVIFLLGGVVGGGEGSVISGGVFAMIGAIWWLTGTGVMAYYDRVAKQRADERRLFETGRRATAVIEEVAPTATTINDMPVVHVTVRIDAQFGQPFRYSRKVVTPASAMPVPGHLVEVAYDPADQSKVAFETVTGFNAAPGVVLKTRPPDGAADPAVAESAPAVAAADDDGLDRLERLAKLHQAGVLTDAEFTEQKTRLLNEG